jgi:hypothetical protein
LRALVCVDAGRVVLRSRRGTEMAASFRRSWLGPRLLESQQRALELSAPTSTMTRTLLNIDAAACSHHDGDTEQAAVVRSLP